MIDRPTSTCTTRTWTAAGRATSSSPSAPGKRAAELAAPAHRPGAARLHLPVHPPTQGRHDVETAPTATRTSRGDRQRPYEEPLSSSCSPTTTRRHTSCSSSTSRSRSPAAPARTCSRCASNRATRRRNGSASHGRTGRSRGSPSPAHGPRHRQLGAAAPTRAPREHRGLPRSTDGTRVPAKESVMSQTSQRPDAAVTGGGKEYGYQEPSAPAVVDESIEDDKAAVVSAFDHFLDALAARAGSGYSSGTPTVPRPRTDRGPEGEHDSPHAGSASTGSAGTGTASTGMAGTGMAEPPGWRGPVRRRPARRGPEPHPPGWRGPQPRTRARRGPAPDPPGWRVLPERESARSHRYAPGYSPCGERSGKYRANRTARSRPLFSCNNDRMQRSIHWQSGVRPGLRSGDAAA